jgi:hypothetical protein
MGAASSAFDFAPHLEVLSEAGVKVKPVTELARASVILKGSFGSSAMGKVAQIKESGMIPDYFPLKLIL